MKKKYLTDGQVVEIFRQTHPNILFYNGGETIDYIARIEAFNNFTDSLCKDGMISEQQYNNIANPF